MVSELHDALQDQAFRIDHVALPAMTAKKMLPNATVAIRPKALTENKARPAVEYRSADSMAYISEHPVQSGLAAGAAQCVCLPASR